MLRLATCVFAVSALLAALSENFATLIVARLLSGFGVGAVLITAPMYIAEISPSAWRGRMVSFNQLFIVLGQLPPSSATYFVVSLGGDAEWNWRWMLGIGVVPAIPYFFALLVVPESPRWLAMHGPAARGARRARAPHRQRTRRYTSSKRCSYRSSTKRSARNPRSRRS